MFLLLQAYIRSSIILSSAIFFLYIIQVSSRPNILLLLADDLGLGDTSVLPFVGSDILTPELEKMAKKGTIMTNFHAAAPTCTPSRAAILTGMFPWRFGIGGVYDYGFPAISNRDDWLPQVPTSAMAFKDAGYYTAHVGKWHLGGMRNHDIRMRRNSKQCPHPGPNQMGFDEYVTMEEGPDSPRQTYLQRGNVLHSQGGSHMLRNDVKEGGGCLGNSNILSDCEANHAIRIMEETKSRNQSFFMHLWFYAPHGPWETIGKYKPMYPKLMKLPPCYPGDPKRFCRPEEYVTMVTALDASIGLVLDALKRLDLERNTIVLFTSDNGPEDDAGSAAGFKFRKRSLYEGGLRVPAIWQWPGRIAEGKDLRVFGMGTDIMPTFLEAAGIQKPPNAMLDGVSLLHYLTTWNASAKAGSGSGAGAGGAKRERHSSNFLVTKARQLTTTDPSTTTSMLDINSSSSYSSSSSSSTSRYTYDKYSEEFQRFNDSTAAYSRQLVAPPATPSRRMYPRQRNIRQSERVALWFKDFEGPRQIAGWIHDFKLHLDMNFKAVAFFDMITDPVEDVNLLISLYNCTDKMMAARFKNIPTTFSPVRKEHRSEVCIQRWIFESFFPIVHQFGKYGNIAHKIYLANNPWRNVSLSYGRNNLLLLNENKLCVEGPCSCEQPKLNEVATLPFDKLNKTAWNARPKVLNASAILSAL